MADDFLTRLAEMEARYEEAQASLALEEVYSNPSRLRTLQREIGGQKRVMQAYREYKLLARQLADAREMLAEGGDEELEQIARSEVETLSPQVEEALHQIRELLVTQDEAGLRNAIMEIRAGTGGDEATLFAGDLLRMYLRLAERRGWSVEMMTETRTEVGGVKEAVLSITGEGVYAVLQFEGGVHRVQRVPATEAQGRIHTSTATVAVLPEAEEVEVELRPDEIEFSTFRASGAGGQHVNRTDSAVRLIHSPTGIKVECQDERSQHKNRARAEKLLRAKIFQHFQDKADAERASARKSLVGSGTRSEKIRTYNYPDSRVKDHRINFIVHDVAGMLGGGEPLDQVLEALANYEKEQKLAEL